MLALITGDNGIISIKTVKKDGSNVNTLVQGIQSITGLAYDRDDKV